MDELMDVLENISELEILPDRYKADLREEMPLDEDECREFGLQTTTKLLEMMTDMPVNLPVIYACLLSRYEAGRYHEMQLMLIMCYLSVGAEPSSCLIQLGLFDDLLARCMAGVIENFGRYVKRAGTMGGWLA